MTSSTDQSLTFHAMAGSRLVGSASKATTSVPPALGDAAALLVDDDPLVLPQPDSSAAPARVVATTNRTVSARSDMRRSVMAPTPFILRPVPQCRPLPHVRRSVRADSDAGNRR